MKLLFTEGIGASQTTTNAQDEKIPVYETIDAASADLVNLEVGQIIATNDKGSELSNPVDVVQDGNMHAVTSNAVSDGLNEVMPAGTILPGMWQTAPKGFLLCDGTTYQTSQYPGLASVLGATGDTFTVPDLRECVMVGVGQNTTHTIATHDVYTLGLFRDDQMQSHTHSYNSPNSYQTLDNGSNYAVYQITNGTSSVNSGRRGETTHGKQFGVNYIIKY